MFQFPQNGNAETDLPRGTGISELSIYILAKGYYFAKVEFLDYTLSQDFFEKRFVMTIVEFSAITGSVHIHYGIMRRKACSV